MEEIAKRLEETIRHSSEDLALLVSEADSEIPKIIPVLNKISAIITSHLSGTSLKNQQGLLESNYCHKDISTADINKNQVKKQICANCHISSYSAKMSGEEQDESVVVGEGQETSLGHLEREDFLKEYLAEHESQVLLWEQMTSFRREYADMRSHVESLLARLHMDFTSVAREASCNFVLLLSQMGCPSCTTGAGLEACCEHVKRVEGDLERTEIEKRSLSTKLESLVQLKSQLQEKLDDRDNIIQSLTETIDQLHGHCRSLEEKSSDVIQWQTFISSLEKTLRSIGRLVVEDSEICGSQPTPVEDSSESNLANLANLPLLADSTFAAVRAALSRRKTEIQQLQSIISDTEKKALESAQHQGDSESRERFLQKETLELRTQLALLLGEKQHLLENSEQSDQLAKVTMMKLEDRESTIQQLKNELETEKEGRRQLEDKLTDLQHEELLHRSSHSELLNEFQQLTCDNQLCRSNLSTFEEKLVRLEKDMTLIREERTRLGIALDFSKDEKSKLNQQVKELTEKTEELKDKLRKSEAERTVAEESLSRLQYLKTSDEAQLSKITLEKQQSEKERSALANDKDELEVEIGALKRELVKAEELRMRLESFSATLERSLQTANSDNDDMKEQIEHLIQINDQLTEKQSIMERRCREIETGNNHLLEEISKLSSEFNNTKEREEAWKDETAKLKSRIIILEEENETLHQQVMGAQNAHQLTQVSMIATQANYDGIQIELERVTKELQALGEEKELLLIEYQDLHQSTSAMLTQLQSENTQQVRRITELEERLKKAQQEQIALNAAHEKDMQNLTLKMQQQLSDAEHQHKIEIESIRSKYEQELQNLQRELSYQITKLQDEIARVEAAKQNALALMQAENQNLQEKLQSCVADLEAERAESSRLRREEVEKQLEHRLAAEALRSEINRLQQELRSAGEARVKDQQMSAQILAATKDNLKKVEEDLAAIRGELAASNRELKDSQRQLETCQLQLNKSESLREEKRKEEMQNRHQLDELRAERDNLRESVIGFQCTIKKFEHDRDELVKCLEEARRRITVLEDNRGVTDQQIAHLRAAVKEAEQQTDRMSKDLSGSQQQLHRTQDQQQRWKERCEVLVEQLQAEQNRAILAEKAANEHINKVQALKLHITQMESQFSSKLSQSGAQNTIHQQRIDEMDATVQKALLRSKRLEDERHNFHSRLIEAHKEASDLKQKLRDADSQSQELTNQLHRVDNEKKELSNRLNSLLSTLRRFVRVLEEGQNRPNDYRTSSRFLQNLSIPLDADSSMNRSNCPDADAIQTILHDLMRHILQLQSKRNPEPPVHDEPTKLDSQRARSRDRQRLLVRQLRDTDENAAGLRERLSASLSAVASSSALGTQTLIRESTNLDGLMANTRSTTQVPIGSAPTFDGGVV